MFYFFLNLLYPFLYFFTFIVIGKLRCFISSLSLPYSLPYFFEGLLPLFYALCWTSQTAPRILFKKLIVLLLVRMFITKWSYIHEILVSNLWESLLNVAAFRWTTTWGTTWSLTIESVRIWSMSWRWRRRSNGSKRKDIKPGSPDGEYSAVQLPRDDLRFRSG